jgi:hypothetical protein
MNNDGQFKAIVFTTFKSQGGFVVHATQRGDDLKDCYTKLGEFIKSEKGVAYEKQSGFPKKQIEYVEGKVCPLDKGRLIKPTAPNRPIKCENSKYDFATKTSSGCAYVEWPARQATSNFPND